MRECGGERRWDEGVKKGGEERGKKMIREIPVSTPGIYFALI